MNAIAVTGGDFTLQQVKLAGGGLKVKYLWRPANQEGSIERTESHGRIVHPDLTAALDLLRGVAGDAINFEDDPAFAPLFVKYFGVTGVKINGEGSKEGAIVEGELQFLGGNGSLTTPKLLLSDCGFGEMLAEALDKVQQEVAEYLFYGKEAQLRIFGEEPEGIFAEENDDSEN